MTKFIDEEGIFSTVERLRQVFKDNSDPQASMDAVAQIIGDVNIVDDRQPEGSPWRNRPLHAVLDDASKTAPNATSSFRERQNAYFARVRQMAADGTLPPKDWSAKSERPSYPPKDWGKPSVPEQPRGLSGTEPAKKDWDNFAPRYMPTTEEIILNRQTWDSTGGSVGVEKFDQ